MAAAEPIARPASIAIGAAKCRPSTSGISLSEMVWVSRRAWTLSTKMSVAAKPRPSPTTAAGRRSR